jgi:5-formyltetrahydrofolate cyclo-ligase
MNGTSEREALRIELRSRRAAIPPDSRNAASQAIAELLLAWDRVRAAAVLAVFRATAEEPEIGPVAGQALESGRIVVVPAYDPDHRGYRFVRQAPGGSWERGPFGIAQPAGGEPFDAGRIVLALVPGLGFDGEGNRLGHGAGHYDRLLAGCPAVRVGVAFDVQRVGRIPPRPGDESMDWIVTESGRFECTRHQKGVR